MVHDEKLGVGIKLLDPDKYFSGVDFPIGKLVRVEIASPSQLEEVLLQMPFKKLSHLSNYNFGSKKREFVNLGNVGGAVTGENWLFYDGNDARNLEYQYNLSKGLISGSCSLMGDQANPELISMFELNGNYYVSGGRHRVAILKAMAVPFIPAEVQHLQNR